MAIKKTKKKVAKVVNGKKIDIGQTLLKHRQVFLFGVVNDEKAIDVIKQLVALDNVNHSPIALYINSPGGSVYSGFAIVDALRGLTSPVITIVMGSACSMGGIISIAGKIRIMTENSVWMAHDGFTNSHGKFNDVIDYGDYIKELQKKIFQFIRENTKLSEKEVNKAVRGQLWLSAKECLQKGVVDQVIVGRNI